MERAGMAITNARGSALLEGLPVVMVLLVFVSGLMLLTYLLFVRVWMQYQGEQALYCLAEGRSRFHCQSRLKSDLDRFLPWGESTAHTSGSKTRWWVEIKWNYKHIRFQLQRELTPELILKNKALRS